MIKLNQLDNQLIEKVKKYVNQNYIEEEATVSDLFGLSETETVEVKYSIFYKPNGLNDLNNRIDKTWQQTVFAFIDSKNFTDPEVYKRASISKQTFSKIRFDINYQPNKDTAIQMCIGLKLNIDESIKLLSKAGYTLSSSIKRDLVVKYFIEEKIYKMDNLNLVLDDMNLKLFPIN